MPDVKFNTDWWNSYDWAKGGAEWTGGYGGPDMAWDSAIEPRIRALLPGRDGHILELGPGFGLWTSRLRNLSARMTLVDLAATCLDGCKAKFGTRNMTYVLNDGKTLPGVADGSVDFVFSWHSLVHCQHDVMSSYARELARVMRVGATGVIQHSNYGEYLDPTTGKHSINNPGTFGEDMTGEKFAKDCSAAGIQVTYQEVVPWGHADHYVSCFSAFRKVRPGEPTTRGTCLRNALFWEETRALGRTLKAYRYPSEQLVIA